VGKTGDTCVDVWELELVFTRIGLSASLAVLSTVLFLDFDDPPRLFSCLNFSSQLEVKTLGLPSGLPQVAANIRALSLIMASVRGLFPSRRWFRAQFARAFSISGTLPLLLLMGERLPSSMLRYFSFWRRTFETVLMQSFCQNQTF
jgi:hypothetical protein